MGRGFPLSGIGSRFRLSIYSIGATSGAFKAELLSECDIDDDATVEGCVDTGCKRCNAGTLG